MDKGETSMQLIHTIHGEGGQERIFDPNTGLVYLFMPAPSATAVDGAQLVIRHLASGSLANFTYDGDNAIAVWAVIRAHAQGVFRHSRRVSSERLSSTG